MLDVIRSIADQGRTMIIVTHEMSFARDVSDRVAYFAEGNILEQGTPEPTTPPACGRGCMTSVRPATLSEFADLNLKMVGFVNNHTGDYGPQGVLDTMNAAEAHDLIACGVGRSLREARLPKFLDMPTSRVGLVATGSTRSEVFAASDSGAGVVPRPGSNPLRWGRAYVLPDELFEQLHQIDIALGTRESMDEGCRVETYPPQGSDAFRFGSLLEGCLNIERGEKAHVRTFVNQKDADEVLKSVADAYKRSDLTILMPLGWESRAIHKIKKIEDQCKNAADNSERRIPRAS